MRKVCIDMNIFDILGPVMVGPSSSHTAGAVRIGYISRCLLKDEPKKAQIFLHGSFATTGVGHGTNRALVAGLLGMMPDDMKIPESLDLAKAMGLEVSFAEKNIKDAHPNTALLILEGKKGKTLEIQASSVGGGRIMVNRLDGIEVKFSAEKPTLIVNNEDRPGHVSEVTKILAELKINIATITLNRDKRGGYAVMVIDLDQELSIEAVKRIEMIPGVIKVTYVNAEGENHGI